MSEGSRPISECGLPGGASDRDELRAVMKRWSLRNSEQSVRAQGKVAQPAQRSTPWARLRRGVWVGEATDLDEVIALADLDWKVDVERPVYIRTNGIELELPGHGATIRRGPTDTPLAIVGSTYEPIQNRVALTAIEGLIVSEQLRPMWAGEWDDGRKVFLAARRPDTLAVAGEDLDIYYEVTSSHDMTRALRVSLYLIRRDSGSSPTVPIPNTTRTHSIKHTSTGEERTLEASSMLVDFREYLRRFVTIAEDLDRKRMGGFEFHTFLRDLLNLRGLRMERTIDQASELFGQERQTRWGAYLALVRWMEINAPVRGGRGMIETELRAMRSLDGNHDKRKSEAITRLS
jgi:hypothetical protein